MACTKGRERRLGSTDATAVELRFEAERSPSLPDPVKARLKRLAGRRWTREGAVVLSVEDTRSQARNRELARERLAELVLAATRAPKRRIATRPTLGAKRRRLKAKKVRGRAARATLRRWAIGGGSERALSAAGGQDGAQHHLVGGAGGGGSNSPQRSNSDAKKVTSQRAGGGGAGAPGW